MHNLPLLIWEELGRLCLTSLAGIDRRRSVAPSEGPRGEARLSDDDELCCGPCHRDVPAWHAFIGRLHWERGGFPADP